MSASIIDFRNIAENQPSLCIPRVFNNINETQIRSVFDQLGLGKIDRIDSILRKNDKGESFKRVYIHFKFWNGDPVSQQAREKLLSGKEIKIVYDNPWFWKVSANKLDSDSTAKKGQAHINNKHAPFIEFDPNHKLAIAPALPQKTDEFGRSIAYRKHNRTKVPRESQRHYTPKPIASTLNPDAKTFEPEKTVAPPSPVAPQREPRDEDFEPDTNYGNIGSIPPKKKLKIMTKQP